MTTSTLSRRPGKNTGPETRTVVELTPPTKAAVCVRMDADRRKEVDVVVAGFAMRLRLWLWAVVATVLAATSLVLFVVMVAGVATVVVWVGLPLLYAAIRAVRPIAALHRRYVGALLGTPIESPYVPPPDGNLLVRLRALAQDPATRRDAMWLTANGTVGVLLTLLAVVEGLLDLIFWWLPKGVFVHAHAHLARALLAPNEKTRLAQRVQELTASRAETVDTSAAELRRIERDLHDGAQARLVSLGMSLGLAEELLGADPGTARTLLAEARASSSEALAELRDLVRGIHPPVLADRGLVGAVEALALASSLPVSITAEVPGRLPAPVESAAYFAVAEALANAIKHSGATGIDVTMLHSSESLDISVRDDGTGGAASELGTGLRGIQRRLAAFDGTLTVESPPGGPTIVAMVLPCASSLPKISPSSETA
jgi:signal transduction histidine kinase